MSGPDWARQQTTSQSGTRQGGTTSMFEQAERARANEKGFTLIELLVAIVVVSILAAVAIVGITGATSSGNKGACQSSADAAKAASVVYFADHDAYPQTFAAMTGGNYFDA